MLRKLRNARFLLAAALLMVILTINGKDLLHSFVQHNPVSCVEHVDGEDELTHHPVAAIDSYKYCLFCHFNFTAYFTTEVNTNVGISFEYFTIVLNGVPEIYLPKQTSTLSLRGPPALV